MLELVAPADPAPVPVPELAVAPAGLRALAGALSVFADGVYSAEAVNALEPAAAYPEAANEDAAAAPLVPDDAFAWMYR